MPRSLWSDGCSISARGPLSAPCSRFPPKTSCPVKRRSLLAIPLLLVTAMSAVFVLVLAAFPELVFQALFGAALPHRCGRTESAAEHECSGNRRVCHRGRADYLRDVAAHCQHRLVATGGQRADRIWDCMVSLDAVGGDCCPAGPEGLTVAGGFAFPLSRCG